MTFFIDGYERLCHDVDARALSRNSCIDPELVLRDDGGSRDLGYPRLVKLAGGKVFVAYYFNRADDTIQCNGGVRHIAGTIFTP